MKHGIQSLAGALLFFGAVQFMLCMVVSEALYTGYNVSDNAISDLGVGSTALIFNASIFLFGLSVVAGAYCVFRASGDRLFSALLVLSGFGAVGAGVFPETTGGIHRLAAFFAFFFGGASAIAAYRMEKLPFNFFSVILGVVSLAALALVLSGSFFGLGFGGMERMVVYPLLLWAVGFGGFLIGKK